MTNYEARTSDNKCVFCEIANGHLPAAIFWEDREFLAFLSIDPNTEGFSCVIPKQHYGSDVLKMPDEILIRFVLVAKKISEILENYYTDVGRVGLVMEGTGIDHAHIKLIPLHDTEHMKRGEWKQYLSKQNHWFDTYEGWVSSAGGPLIDREELKVLAEKIRKSLK
ncbi:HIT family protein [Patescibacteria group bacterium]|nr:HIT family protein [Patescibacteria group bacterium]